MTLFRLQVSSQFSAMVHNELEEARAGMDLLAGERMRRGDVRNSHILFRL